MTEADRAQPAQDQQDAPTLEEFTEGIRSLETMASRLGIKAISTGHDYWPGTEAARDKLLLSSDCVPLNEKRICHPV